jgi:hypothetical protein
MIFMAVQMCLHQTTILDPMHAISSIAIRRRTIEIAGANVRVNRVTSKMDDSIV